MPIRSIDPSTGKTIKIYKEHTSEEVSEILKSSYDVFLTWRKTDFSERSKLMKNCSAILRENKEEYASLMTSEMGKPIKGARSEVEKCALGCDYYALKAQEFLRKEEVKTDASKSFISYQPLGPILAIMPWNFPFWQVFRFGAPAIMAGNTAIVKHALNVSGCAYAIEDIFLRAGFPKNIYKTVLVQDEDVSGIIENDHIKAVTLTGSIKAGMKVASKAGENIKKTVLELGGSDPYIVLEDANIEEAALACAASRLINSGQTCIAAKRIIVIKTIFDKFIDLFIKSMEKEITGDPGREDTTIGPMARKDLRDNLKRQVDESIKKGARSIFAGKIPEKEGFYYPLTVLIDVKKGMPAYDEEIFGPVAVIISAKDEVEAIKIANDSDFGLGAAVFTGDLSRGERIAEEELEAGCAFVNGFVRSDPRLPFGGIKKSGYGRELSHFGIREFVNIKTIYLN